jgi:hypothetical protein
MRGISVVVKRLAIGVGVGTLASMGAGATAWAAPPQTEGVVLTIDPVTGNETFVATGPASGSGFDNVISTTQTGRTQSGIDQFIFTDGPSAGSSFTVKHTGHETGVFDPVTCTETLSGSGSFVDIAGNGALSNVKGSGGFTETGTITFATDCNPNGIPTSGSITVTAIGNIKV